MKNGTRNTAHTPTPWRNLKAVSGHWAIYGSEGKQLVRFGEGQDEFWKEPARAKANAAFIVRAVNNLDNLVDLLMTRSVDNHHNNKHPGNWRDCDSDMCQYDKAAIAKAEGL